MPFKFVGNKDRIIVKMGTGDIHIAKGYGVTEPSEAAVIFRPKPEAGAAQGNDGEQVDDFPVALTFSTPTSVDAMIRVLQDFKRWQFPAARPLQPRLSAPKEGAEYTNPTDHGTFQAREARVEAFRLTTDSRRDNSGWPRWMHEAWQTSDAPGGVFQATDDVLYVRTATEQATCIPGDWIVKCEDGSLAVWPNEVFAYFYQEIHDLAKAGDAAAKLLAERGIEPEPPRFTGETYPISTLLDILKLPTYDQVRRCCEELGMMIPQCRAANDLFIETTRHLMEQDGKTELAKTLPTLGYEFTLPIPWTDDDGGRSVSQFRHPGMEGADFNLQVGLTPYTEREGEPGPDAPRGKEYVVGFLFRNDGEEVALIRKNKPSWQDGKLNGIGGKIEDGEAAHAAMTREFHEEADAIILGWREIATMVHRLNTLHFFVATAPEGTEIRTKTEEPVDWYNVADLLFRANAPKDGMETVAYPEIIRNLAWLIPMARDKDRLASIVIDPS